MRNDTIEVDFDFETGELLVSGLLKNREAARAVACHLLHAKEDFVKRLGAKIYEALNRTPKTEVPAPSLLPRESVVHGRVVGMEIRPEFEFTQE